EIKRSGSGYGGFQPGFLLPQDVACLGGIAPVVIDQILAEPNGVAAGGPRPGGCIQSLLKRDQSVDGERGGAADGGGGGAYQHGVGGGVVGLDVAESQCGCRGPAHGAAVSQVNAIFLPLIRKSRRTDGSDCEGGVRTLKHGLANGRTGNGGNIGSKDN